MGCATSLPSIQAHGSGSSFVGAQHIAARGARGALIVLVMRCLGLGLCPGLNG